MRLPIAAASILFGCLLTGAPANITAPGSEGFHKLYGEPTMERFTVQRGITLTVEYGPDHLACHLLIAPAQSLVELQSPIPAMSSQGVSVVLEELLPVDARGRQIDSTTIQVDPNTMLQSEYENVSIRRFCSSQSCASSSENQDVRTIVVFKRDACQAHVE